VVGFVILWKSNPIARLGRFSCTLLLSESCFYLFSVFSIFLEEKRLEKLG
jgi:hypothetical protein